MNYMQLKTGPGAVSGEEREGFCLKAYRKSELAGLYFPQAGKKGALQGLGRWIKQCAELERELELFPDHACRNPCFLCCRKFFLKSEVELIVRFLGEP